MISISWKTTTEGPCPTCNQPITVKHRTVKLFGLIPISHKATNSCGCAKTG
jgi:hypothetical protein